MDLKFLYFSLADYYNSRMWDADIIDYKYLSYYGDQFMRKIKG